jgi:hypothetical protein
MNCDKCPTAVDKKCKFTRKCSTCDPENDDTDCEPETEDAGFGVKVAMFLALLAALLAL